ncbi:MAG: hypothetical protein C4K49_02550 [Candidatus Thorarchaeota archaeon]|nr:MAG: hypothetical protein C4K49_02550 [Candidatus Thorarchaeota archaeon]
MGLAVAIPDASLADCSDLRDKTIKVGALARAFAVFRVDTVVVYDTGLLRHERKSDANVLVTLLRYMDTPQYLRRRVFPQSASLRYAGLLPPLRTRSHPLNSDTSSLAKGELRWGVQDRTGKVDIGTKTPVDYHSPVSATVPTLFRITDTTPEVKLEVVSRKDAELYWGFETKSVGSLLHYLEVSAGSTRIALSRTAPPFKSQESAIGSAVAATKSVVAMFGGPYHGLQEIFSSDLGSLRNCTEFWINTIPDQGTETVRLEEAVFASLALLNNSIGPLIQKPGYHT